MKTHDFTIPCPLCEADVRIWWVAGDATVGMPAGVDDWAGDCECGNHALVNHAAYDERVVELARDHARDYDPREEWAA